MRLVCTIVAAAAAVPIPIFGIGILRVYERPSAKGIRHEHSAYLVIVRRS